LAKLCGLFGKTRQAWYEATWHQDRTAEAATKYIQANHRARSRTDPRDTTQVRHLKTLFYAPGVSATPSYLGIRYYRAAAAYIRLLNGFCYLTLITDAYSRMIVGYCLWPSLHAEGVLNALKMEACFMLPQLRLILLMKRKKVQLLNTII